MALMGFGMLFRIQDIMHDTEPGYEVHTPYRLGINNCNVVKKYKLYH